MAPRSATERTPLLQVEDEDDSVQVEPASSFVPQEIENTNLAHSTDVHDSAIGAPKSSRSSTPTPKNLVSDIEQQQSQIPTDQSIPYGGIPEARKRLHITIPAMAIGLLLAAADQTIVVSSYGKIGTDLNALSRTSWIATAYFLTLTSFQPLYGKLSDIFSRKSCLLFAYTVFGIGCVLCGLAPNMDTLIVARAIAGIGGGGMSTICVIIVSDIIPLRDRGTWQGYLNIIYATGAGLGAPIGGILADSVGWRWAFLAQGPLCAVAFFTVAMWLHLPVSEDAARNDKLKRIDFIGAVTLIIAVLSLLIAMDRGSNVAWSDKYTIAALCTTIPLFSIFLAVERWVAREPFAPGRIVFGRSLFACYVCYFFIMGAYMVAIFCLPLYWQVVMGVSAAQSGLQLIPPLVFATSGSLAGGYYIKLSGKYKTITIIASAGLLLGTLIILVASGAILPLSNVASTAGTIVGMCITGFCCGVCGTTLLISLIANVDPADQAVATACSYLFRSLGSVIGVSLAATATNLVLRGSLQFELGKGKEATEIATRVRLSLAYLRELEPEVRGIVIKCYAQGIRSAFALQAGFAVIAGVSVWWMREKHLKK